jgi:Zn-dependent peptidase ImmA (M78 family)
VTEFRISYPRVRRHAAILLARQFKPPVNLDAIVSALGAEVRPLDLAADISGILYRQPDRRVIVVNQNQSEARRRFTIAHEIGHLVLHKGEEVHVDAGFRINLRDPRSATAEDVEEIEANAFAANLLMPAAWLKTDVVGETIDWSDSAELEELAQRYKVSPQAMLVRLSSLFSER